MSYSSLKIGTVKPKSPPPSVKQIEILGIGGPWTTKSDASLSLLFQLPNDRLSSFLDCDIDEVLLIPRDIRGLRSYFVDGLDIGKIGGKEFHRVRKELFFSLQGSLQMECTDVYGEKRVIELNRNQGILIPPFTLHTYTVLEKGSFLVVANTLYDPKDPQTHDSYSEEDFTELQKNY